MGWRISEEPKVISGSIWIEAKIQASEYVTLRPTHQADDHCIPYDFSAICEIEMNSADMFTNLTKPRSQTIHLINNHEIASLFAI